MSYEGIDVGCFQSKVGGSQLGNQQETRSHQFHINFVSYGHERLYCQKHSAGIHPSVDPKNVLSEINFLVERFLLDLGI